MAAFKSSVVASLSRAATGILLDPEVDFLRGQFPLELRLEVVEQLVPAHNSYRTMPDSATRKVPARG